MTSDETPQELTTLQGRRLRSALFALVRPRVWMIVTATVLQGVTVALSLIPPLLLGRLVDGYVAHRPPALGPIVLALLGSLLAAAVVGFASSRVAFGFGEAVFADLRTRFFGDVVGLPLSTVEKLESGEVLARTTSDLDTVHEVARTGVPETLVGLLTLVVTIVMAFVVNPVVALGTFLGLPLIIVSTRWYVRRAPAVYEEELAAKAAVMTVAGETVRGAQTVAALDLGAVRDRRYRQAVRRAEIASRRPLGLEARWFPFVQFGYQLPVVATLAIGVPLIASGVAQVGQVASIALFMRTIVDPLDDVIYWFGEAQSAHTAFGRILGMHQFRPAAEPLDVETVDATDAALELSGVTFAYPGGPPVVKDVSLTVNAGERICVIGASGAGKTTLGLLAIGALEPDSGTVRVNGRLVDPGDGQVAMVAQDAYIFVGSLRENVALASLEPDDALVWSCLDAVQASWAHDLPDGLDTQLAEDGLDLTPVQTQQVALARVLYSRPRVLVLDEATAALPAPVAAALPAELERRMPDTAIFQIAHDLVAARDADIVIVVEDGQVIETGPHETLLRHGGTYARLWRLGSGSAPTR